MIVKLDIPGLNRDNAEEFEAFISAKPYVYSVDTWLGRAEVKLEDGKSEELLSDLSESDFKVESVVPEKPIRRTYMVSGMTCRSCEINLESKLKKVAGVRKAVADVGSSGVLLVCDASGEPTLKKLNRALAGSEYQLGEESTSASSSLTGDRPGFLRVLALMAAVLVLGELFGNLRFLGDAVTVSEQTGFAAAVVIGLVAGASSCIAVSGGLLLSSVAQYRSRYGSGSLGAKMAPAAYFVAGRTVSYALLGGVIGAVGAAVTPPPIVTGLITVLAACFMVVMGLDMLGLAPAWLKRLLPRMPKSLAHKVVEGDGGSHPFAPAALGAATFFLPCGFTQSLQLYALTSGSFWSGALLLGGFALGTVPALLALSFASTSLKGKAGRLFFHFAGVAVIMLGIWNAQNGLTVAGYPVALLWTSRGAQFSGDASAAPPKVTDNLQVIKMTAGGQGGAYVPDVLTVKAGVPVRWEIEGVSVGGCLAGLVSPQLGISTWLKRGVNVVEFTPEKAGTYSFSCHMGMVFGTINVI